MQIGFGEPIKWSISKSVNQHYVTPNSVWFFLLLWILVWNCTGTLREYVLTNLVIWNCTGTLRETDFQDQSLPRLESWLIWNNCIYLSLPHLVFINHVNFFFGNYHLTLLQISLFKFLYGLFARATRTT